MRSCKILSFSLLLVYAAAQADQLTDSQLTAQPMSFQGAYTQYNMPNGGSPLGVASLEGLVNFTPNWYGGLGLDSSVSGEYGGYFALNIDGGYQHPLVGPVWVDMGAKVGAGGGHQTPVGTGFFYQPYAGLSYHFQAFNLGLDYSYVNFPSGSIHSSQAELVLTIPFDVDVADADLAGSSFDFSGGNLAFDRDYLALVGQGYFPASSVTNTSGQSDTDNFQLLGAEFGHYFSQNFFAFMQATGAAHGHSNGYAALLIGPGYQVPLTDWLNAVGKLGLGSAGGAGVDTGGGFIVEPTLGLDFLLTPTFSAEVDGGYLDAPDGSLKAAVMSLMFKYRFDHAYLAADDVTGPAQLSYQGWRLRLMNETYFDPERTASSSTEPMQLANVNVDYALNHYFYLTGQTAFAYSGGQVGGYFSGLMGVGAQVPIDHNCPVAIFAEALGGAAGGAGLDIGDGALVEPLLGLNYQSTASWGLQASVGRLIALQGGFSSTVMNAGVSYRFSTLGH